ncbi:MAG: hypothetical protein QXP42_04180 [Candidatus Micrarchaeia archaeon]
MIYCNVCGIELRDWEPIFGRGRALCHNCYTQDLDRYYNKPYMCGVCGARIGMGEAVQFKGRVMCGDCYKEEEKKLKENSCSICGKEVSFTRYVKDGELVCKECYEKETKHHKVTVMVCSLCHKNVGIDETRIVDGHHLCQACYGDFIVKVCGICGRRITGITPKLGSRVVCHECYIKKSSRSTCAVCGKPLLTMYITDDGKTLCVECSLEQRKKPEMGGIRTANAVLNVRKIVNKLLG